LKDRYWHWFRVFYNNAFVMRKKLPQLSEENLVYEISIKSRLGAETFYDMYSSNLYGIIFKIVNNKELAEDLLQQVLMKVWGSIDSYDITRGRLFTWMLTIARNMAKDMLRSRQYVQSLMTDDIDHYIPQIDKSFHVIFNNDVLFIKSMVTRLKKDQKEIIDLIYFKGYTQQEAAEELSLPLGTVKTRCRAAINSLRVIFIPKQVVPVHLLAS
jgi:RNA polymerase sigma factor (sigma-70 family)